MKKKMVADDIYEENPFGHVKLGQVVRRIEDLVGFPSPEAIAASLKTTKVTLGLDPDTIVFFKKKAKELGVPYQLMIRRLLSDYTARNRP